MRKIVPIALALIAASAASSYAQEATPGACSTPESIIVAGNSRLDSATVRGNSTLATGTTLSVQNIQSAIKALYATGQFEDVQILCRIGAAGKATLVIQVKERPTLTDYKIIGATRVAPKDVKEKLAFATGSPVDPGKIAKAIASVDSLYESKGYYLASVKAESTITNGNLSINFTIDEGRRLAISGIRINGNKQVPAEDVVAAMDTKPEAGRPSITSQPVSSGPRARKLGYHLRTDLALDALMIAIWRRQRDRADPSAVGPALRSRR